MQRAIHTTYPRQCNYYVPHFLSAAPATAPEAWQVGVVLGGDKSPERDDDVQQQLCGQPPHTAATARQVILVAALALIQEHISSLGGQCLTALFIHLVARF